MHCSAHRNHTLQQAAPRGYGFPSRFGVSTFLSGLKTDGFAAKYFKFAHSQGLDLLGPGEDPW